MGMHFSMSLALSAVNSGKSGTFSAICGFGMDDTPRMLNAYDDGDTDEEQSRSWGH
jgi:hypothetical protein